MLELATKNQRPAWVSPRRMAIRINRHLGREGLSKANGWEGVRPRKRQKPVPTHLKNTDTGGFTNTDGNWAFFVNFSKICKFVKFSRNSKALHKTQENFKFSYGITIVDRFILNAQIVGVGGDKLRAKGGEDGRVRRMSRVEPLWQGQ